MDCSSVQQLFLTRVPHASRSAGRKKKKKKRKPSNKPPKAPKEPPKKYSVKGAGLHSKPSRMACV